MATDQKSVSSDLDQKASLHHLESPAARTEYNGVAFTEADGKAARRKVDLCLVSTLTLYYFVSYLDRSNLGNAKVAGIEKDLGMTGKYDYNTAISIYFVPYILFEYPCAIFLKKAGPDRLLPSLVVLWGIVTMCQGWVHTYGGLLACRFFLGALEAGLTPCSVVLMSMYIRRFDLQKRIAVFFAMISLAGAFAGLLAYAITKNLSGAHGYAGWRWIFILEGAGTIAAGLGTFYMIPRSPSRAWWLSAPQKAALLAGLEADNTAYVESSEEHGLGKGVKIFWTSPMALIYLGLNAAAGFFTNGLPYFIPPIIKGLGYTAVQAQLHTVPPYVVAFGIALITSTLGDKIRCRTAMLSFGGAMGLIGYIIQWTTPATRYPIKYAAIFFIVGGSGALSSSVSAWGLSNASGHVRRATLIAFGFMTSNTISLASVWAFRASEAPAYHAGSCLGLTATIIITVIPGLTSLNLWRINRKRETALAALPAGYQHPEGVVEDTDIRFKYSY